MGNYHELPEWPHMRGGATYSPNCLAQIALFELHSPRGMAQITGPAIIPEMRAYAASAINLPKSIGSSSCLIYFGSWFSPLRDRGMI